MEIYKLCSDVFYMLGFGVDLLQDVWGIKAGNHKIDGGCAVVWIGGFGSYKCFPKNTRNPPTGVDLLLSKEKQCRIIQKGRIKITLGVPCAKLALRWFACRKCDERRSCDAYYSWRTR